MGETSVGEARESPHRHITVLLTVLKEGFLEDKSDVEACLARLFFPKKILKKKV